MQTLTPPSSTCVEVGVDEVGRGCLSHAVVAAACILPPLETLDMAHRTSPLLALIKDSKKLSEKRRNQVVEFIKKIAVAWAVGEASVEEIDRVNILQATFLAMHRALDAVYAQRNGKFNHILVDGPHFKNYFQKQEADHSQYKFIANTCVPSGDAVYMSIAAASILAKCHRDNMVCEITRDDPELAKYGFESHKGYGTKTHMHALKTYGVTVHHRKSFGPVAALL